MEFVIRIVLIVRTVLVAGSSLSQDCPLTIEVESRGISWKPVESRPVTIKVGFRSGSSYDDKVSESNDEVEFL